SDCATISRAPGLMRRSCPRKAASLPPRKWRLILDRGGESFWPSSFWRSAYGPWSRWRSWAATAFSYGCFRSYSAHQGRPEVDLMRVLTRRDILTAHTPDRHHVSSAVVLSRPECREDVTARLSAMSGVE